VTPSGKGDISKIKEGVSCGLFLGFTIRGVHYSLKRKEEGDAIPVAVRRKSRGKGKFKGEDEET